MRRLIGALLVAVVAFFVAVPSAFAAQVTVTGGGPTRTIVGNLSDGSAFSDLGGVVLTTGGEAYCADINTLISIGDTVDEVPWNDLGAGSISAASLAAISAIVNYEYPETGTGFTLVGDASEQAAGVQAAIWHFSNGFNLSTDPADNTVNVLANYETILDRVAGNDYPSLQPRVLTVVPTNSTVGEDTIIAFTVTSSLGDATLSVTGATRVDASGNAVPNDPIPDGGQFYLVRPDAGTAAITLTATGPGKSALAFDTPGIQRLVGARITPEPLSTSAAATWTAAGTTTTTTSPSTTSTAPPVTVSPGQVTAPPTTAAAGSTSPVQVGASQVSSGALPRTGGEPLPMVWFGVAAAGAGVVLLLASTLRLRRS